MLEYIGDKTIQFNGLKGDIFKIAPGHTFYIVAPMVYEGVSGILLAPKHFNPRFAVECSDAQFFLANLKGTEEWRVYIGNLSTVKLEDLHNYESFFKTAEQKIALEVLKEYLGRYKDNRKLSKEQIEKEVNKLWQPL